MLQNKTKRIRIIIKLLEHRPIREEVEGSIPGNSKLVVSRSYKIFEILNINVRIKIC
jgi:hypothetical protein